MQVPLMDLKAEYQALRSELLPALDEALSSMQLMPGPNLPALEEEMAAACGVRYAIACASGTDACRLALQAAGIGPGDEVITVAWTFIATIASVIHAGAQPVLVDVEPRHLNLDPQQVAEAVTPRTRAIMPVHIYGYPADMAALGEIAERHGLLILEDACQAQGARWQGRPVGSLGAAAAFSFYPSKVLGAYGDAGMITTDCEQIAAQARLLRNHGYTGKYDHAVLGYNSRMDEVQAVILRLKLARLDWGLQQRRRQAEYYSQALADTPLALPIEEPGVQHCFYMYATRAPQRDELVAFLQERGIGTAQHYVNPAHRQPALEPYGLGGLSLPVTEQAARDILILPCHQYLSDEQIAYVAEQVREFYG